ncbi:class B sortase [Agathobacter sp.]|uniref:class B sortase n=1 Tax=Agathobacter sp. TaxID=2021311 RepID=UPI002A91B935|nr:class B sortase [Agathobacter sp.]MDY5863209.1 class B sortase [Agathobacter sp.]
MKKKTSTIIIAVLACIIAICLVIIVRHVWIQKNNNKVYDNLQSEVHNTTEQIRDTVATEDTQEPISVDFNVLWDTNPDIYAWIEIPNTKVAYPVLQKDGDDDYYLDVTVEGNSGLPGSIYSQASKNSKDFNDFNTILYGHNMKDGSIFGTLKNYRDVSYWEEHPEIIIYTPNQKFTYRIFAAVVYGDELIPNKYDFETIKGRQAFLDSIYSNSDSRSIVDSEIEVNTDSKLLTLSTCIGNESNNRYLVIGVLENK